MLRRSKTSEAKEQAASGAQLAAVLAKDKKFRKELLSALGHAGRARERAASRVGYVAAAQRLATDEELRRELSYAIDNARAAWARLQTKRSNRGRKALLVIAGTGAAAAVVALPPIRRRVRPQIAGLAGRGGTTPRVIDEAIEVGVPVSTAYNQWTQFEDFPLFMEGVEHVQQLDDTRLHWVASIAGRRAEWDAKILEQHPDRQISWISEDGKKTRGTVSFEPLGDGRTLVRLSMSYQAEGAAEAFGSGAGLDAWRVRGDLERFKELIEGREAESGAWRGEISAGTTNSA